MSNQVDDLMARGVEVDPAIYNLIYSAIGEKFSIHDKTKAVIDVLREVGLDLSDYVVIKPPPQPPIRIEPKGTGSSLRPSRLPSRRDNDTLGKEHGIVMNEGDGMTQNDLDKLYGGTD